MCDGTNRCRLAIALLTLVTSISGALRVHAAVLPPGFELQSYVSGFDEPVGMAFAPDGRLFILEKAGRVRVVTANRVLLPTPFLDISAEVNFLIDRGLVGIAFHPDFPDTPWIYFVHVAAPPPGSPIPPSGIPPTYGRLLRVQPDVTGNVADLTTLEILIGEVPSQGFIHCYTTHTVGTIAFANDGSLFVGMGEGAHWEETDPGGMDPICFSPPLFDPEYDIGAFRSQDLDAPAGKIWRIDPETAGGLPDNPYWTGNADDHRSKVWASGLRNPFRFTLQPGSQTPETIWTGDVGQSKWEEFDVAHGGENFGWPCYEGPVAFDNYLNATPAHSGCDTLQTPDNPGPVTPPIMSFHHTQSHQSSPVGHLARAAIAGVFYTGERYPPRYRGRFLFADYVTSWIGVLDPADIGEAPAPVAAGPPIEVFVTGAGRPTAFTTHPQTGDVYYTSLQQNKVNRIVWVSPPQDVDFDADVDLIDFRAFQSCAAADITARPDCRPFDANADNDVDVFDFNTFIDAVNDG
ncbi:MAG: hypothetical protein HOP29_03420 [Phycisphaerales bacterium]|nr:hypothetical protein [Phycisphaerales bacterium]